MSRVRSSAVIGVAVAMMMVVMRSRFVVVIVVGASVGGTYLRVRCSRGAAVGVVFGRAVGAIIVLEICQEDVANGAKNGAYLRWRRVISLFC
jgi:hypothetical protein